MSTEKPGLPGRAFRRMEGGSADKQADRPQPEAREPLGPDLVRVGGGHTEASIPPTIPSRPHHVPCTVLSLEDVVAQVKGPS